MSNRNRPSGIEREMRRRRQRRMADLNRNDHGIFAAMLRIALVALAVIIGICIWFWAAVQQAQEVEAAVLRAHRITDGPMYSAGPGAEPGQNQNCPIMVPELPDFPPADGEPPEAIEIKMASQAEAVPEEHWESLGTFKISHYCACRRCSGKWGHRTSSGATCQEGVTVAVDPRVLPEGAEIYIEGYGNRIVQDTGGGVRGRHIDVFYEDHQECLDRGIQYREVKIRRGGD